MFLPAFAQLTSTLGHSVSTYHFSPVTGLIEKHVVDSIHPAPHFTAFDALKRILTGGAFPDVPQVPQVRPCRVSTILPEPNRQRDARS